MKCTPRKGRPGSGTGYIRPRTRDARWGSQGKVLSPERNDAHAYVDAHHARDAVGVQPGAVDDVGRGYLAGGRVDDQAAVAAGYRDDLGAGHEVSAGGRQIGSVCPRDGREIDDSGVRREDGSDSGRVRLKLHQPLPSDYLKALGAVGGPPPVQLFEAGYLRVVGGDDHLAAHLVGYPALVAVGPEHRAAGGAEVGLLGPGRVVDAGVDHAAVVPGLVGGDLGLLLKHDGTLPGEVQDELPRRREADYAAADDRYVVGR